jgi:hypothetical protein
MATSAEVGRIVVGVLYILAMFALSIFQFFSLFTSLRSHVFSENFKNKARLPYILVTALIIVTLCEEIFVAWGGTRYTKDGLEEFGTRFVFACYAWAETIFLILVSVTLFVTTYSALNVDDGMDSIRSKVIKGIMAFELGVLATFGFIVEAVHTIILFFSYKTVYDHGYFVAMNVLHTFFLIGFIATLITVVVLLILSGSVWKSETFAEEYRPIYEFLVSLLVIMGLFTVFLILMDIGRPRGAPPGYTLFWYIIKKIGTGLALGTASVYLFVQYMIAKKGGETYSTSNFVH